MIDETVEGFYIMSIKWSTSDIVTWWRADNAGYTLSLDTAGVYTAEQVEEHPNYYNDGESTAAIPVSEAVKHVVRIVSTDSFRALRAVRKSNP